MTAQVDPLDEGGLFGDLPDDRALPDMSLMDRHLEPPFSVLDRRTDRWHSRRRRWLALGIRSEVGRGSALTYAKGSDVRETVDDVSRKLAGGHYSKGNGTSVFDPYLAELCVRWFSRPGDRVLDPFAGGSVRGVVASHMRRDYVGTDLSPEQIAANYAQADIAHPDHPPRWIMGDAADPDAIAPDECAAGFDLVLTCPPYADLERYTDDPRDLSTMDYPAFTEAYVSSIRTAVDRLHADRFICWVIGDVRDPRTGTCRDLPGLTITALRAAGADLHMDAPIIDPIGSAAIRAENQFRVSRSLVRTHQTLIVAVKGSPKKAAARLGGPADLT